MTPIKVLITVLTKSHEPPSSSTLTCPQNSILSIAAALSGPGAETVSGWGFKIPEDTVYPETPISLN